MVRMGHISFGNPVDLCVPTGNFGNILSAYYAKVPLNVIVIHVMLFDSHEKCEYVMISVMPVVRIWQKL